MTDKFPVLQKLFSANSQWAEDVEKADGGFFERSAKGQGPHALWIGCADSRVPESVITHSRPGDIFVHRNIANQLPLDDDNALSVLEYAVHYLGVQHVIVVGHSGCGGASTSLAAVQSESYSTYGSAQTLPQYPASHALNRWLAPLTELVQSLDVASKSVAEALPIVVDANVVRQVENLSKTAAIKRARDEGKEVWIHGWVYELATGNLRDLGVSRPADAAAE